MIKTAWKRGAWVHRGSSYYYVWANDDDETVVRLQCTPSGRYSINRKRRELQKLGLAD